MNMGSIYKQFEKEQEKLRKEYLAAGMTEVQIDELYEYDKKQLSRDIAYQRWTQPLVSEDTDFEDDSQNALLKKFSLSTWSQISQFTCGGSMRLKIKICLISCLS